MDVNTITPIELEEMLHRLAHACYKADTEYVEIDEEYQILDDNKKTVFAGIVDAQEGSTTAEKERRAYLSEGWKEYLLGYQTARKKARLAKVERDKSIRFFETCRSILSSKNKERNMN